MRPRWTLRYLTRFGWSIVLVLVWLEDGRPLRDHDLFFLFKGRRRDRPNSRWSGRRAGAGRRRQHRFGCRRCPWRNVTSVDPRLHTNEPERGVGLCLTVVDIGANGMQRNPALALPLTPRHLRSAQAARNLHADALRSEAHGATH